MAQEVGWRYGALRAERPGAFARLQPRPRQVDQWKMQMLPPALETMSPPGEAKTVLNPKPSMMMSAPSPPVTVSLPSPSKGIRFGRSRGRKPCHPSRQAPDSCA
jgi:hypothetical protein